MFAVPVRTPAAQTFRGETSQHRSASVLVAPDGTVARIRAITARRVSSRLWRGTFRTQVILVKHDKWLDTCRLRGVTWKAKLIA